MTEKLLTIKHAEKISKPLYLIGMALSTTQAYFEVFITPRDNKDYKVTFNGNYNLYLSNDTSITVGNPRIVGIQKNLSQFGFHVDLIAPNDSGDRFITGTPVLFELRDDSSIIISSE